MANLFLNEVILCGRLTADVELKTTTSGISVCSFTLAINRKTAKDQEQKTDFVKCVAWRQTAEFISRYFKKGSSLCITGSIQTRTWKDNNGYARDATEIVVDEAKFVDSKGDSAPADTYDAPAFAKDNEPQFEEVGADDDLPF